MRRTYWIASLKPSLIPVLLFTGVLSILPYTLRASIPCLSDTPFVSYDDNACNLDLVLNRYLTIALAGFSTILVGFFLWRPNTKPQALAKDVLPMLVAGVLMAGALILSFLSYIPTAETAVRNAPIILETGF